MTLDSFNTFNTFTNTFTPKRVCGSIVSLNDAVYTQNKHFQKETLSNCSFLSTLEVVRM